MASPNPPVRVIGAPPALIQDFYHKFLEISWFRALGGLILNYLLLNAIFATGYWWVGGVNNMRPGMWRDAFFFSVQTMGTIGYGGMFPASDASNALVVVESVVGLIVTAVYTGLVFAKFGRTVARVRFAEQAVIGVKNDIPTLMIRLGNDRFNRILDAQFHVTLVRTERDAAGRVFYRMYDLPLVRSRTASLSRFFVLFHEITPSSKLYGYTPEQLAIDEGEIHVSVSGLDDLTLQPVHATATYTDAELRWGARFADMLTVFPDGALEVDLRKFHTTEDDPLPEA